LYRTAEVNNGKEYVAEKENIFEGMVSLKRIKSYWMKLFVSLINFIFRKI